jgi:uncharacterized repeat protein (TIGR02543 family)
LTLASYTSANTTGGETLVFNNTGTTTVTGAITPSATTLSLTKNNATGTLILGGTCAYTGATAVNAGTVLVNGSTHANSAVTVAANAILGGSGTINGTLSVTAGGILKLGASGATLTLANATAPTYNQSGGTTYTTFKLSASAATLDKISASATTGNSVADVDLIIDTTGLSGSVASTVIYEAGGDITGPFHSVTVVGNTAYVPTVDYSTSGQIKLALSSGTTYSVTYDGNGGTGTAPTDTNTYATGASVTLANSGSLVKTGFVFTGWNTLASGLGTHYNPAATFTMGSANVILYADWKTPYDNWAAAYGLQNPWLGVNPLLNGEAGADPDGDAFNNLKEFAFAFNPTVSDGSGPLTISGGAITQNGPPQIYEDPVTGQFFLRYTRRSDHTTAGLAYTAQFAADSLGAGSFENVAGGSVVGSGTGAGGVAIQAIAIEFPDALPVSGKKARFGRLEVTQTP